MSTSIEERIIFPILKAYDWVGKEHAVHQNFLDIDRTPMPVIAYGHDMQHSYMFITKKEKINDLDEFYSDALSNLTSLDAKWVKAEENVVSASGDDFSSEQILNKDFLLQAGKLLETDKLHVAIPKRTLIFAVNANASEEELNHFYSNIRRIYEDDTINHAPITNLVFEFTDGEYTGAQLIEINKD
jgi:hypothetical protein